MLCNDGLMIEKDKYEDELLIKFNEVIKEKMNFVKMEKLNYL